MDSLIKDIHALIEASHLYRLAASQPHSEHIFDKQGNDFTCKIDCEACTTAKLLIEEADNILKRRCIAI